MKDLPTLFHIPESALADLLGPHLYPLGAVVIADPAHLTGDLAKSFDTVTGLEDYQLTLRINAVDWTIPIAWDPTDPAAAARDLVAVAENPAVVWVDPEIAPPGTPQRVTDWLGLAPAAVPQG
jgi:hypothetical protein